MKFIEKARELRPELSVDEIISTYHPYELGLEELTFSTCDSCAFCTDCWNREMPEG